MRQSIRKGVLAAAVAGCAAGMSAGAAHAAVQYEMWNTTGTTVNVAGDSSGGLVTYQNPLNRTNVGSGVIDPFLTIQNNGSESGFSTDAANNNLPLDTKRAGGNAFARTFSLGSLLEVGGSFVFSLDINEINSDDQRWLSLDSLSIYLTDITGDVDIGATKPPGNTPDVTNLNQLPRANWITLYSLDTANADNSILLNYDFFSGSGIGYDMEMLIPVSVFASQLPVGVDTNRRIVFTSEFGALGTSTATSTTPSRSVTSDDGFEEWSYYRIEGGTQACPEFPAPTAPWPICYREQEIPEPGSLLLLGLGLAGLSLLRRRVA